VTGGGGAKTLWKILGGQKQLTRFGIRGLTNAERPGDLTPKKVEEREARGKRETQTPRRKKRSPSFGDALGWKGKGTFSTEAIGSSHPRDRKLHFLAKEDQVLEGFGGETYLNRRQARFFWQGKIDSTKEKLSGEKRGKKTGR